MNLSFHSLLDINIRVLYAGQNYGGNLHFENTEQVLKLSTSLDLERKLSFSIEVNIKCTFNS